MHSSLGYRTPAEALTEFHQAATAAYTTITNQ